MSRGAFTDRAQLPLQPEIEATLAGAGALWSELVSFIESGFRVRSDWKFYGKSYGWALAFKKSGKALVSLYPASGAFSVQLILKEEQIASIPAEAMIPELRLAIREANPYSEGRWIFLEASSRRELDVAKRLIEIRAAGA